jgi:hypothetical protein
MTHNDLRYEVGPSQLNPGKRFLTRDGDGTPLTPKATGMELRFERDWSVVKADYTSPHHEYFTYRISRFMKRNR